MIGVLQGLWGELSNVVVSILIGHIILGPRKWFLCLVVFQQSETAGVQSETVNYMTIF